MTLTTSRESVHEPRGGKNQYMKLVEGLGSDDEGDEDHLDR
jgi:hypothetical protein